MGEAEFLTYLTPDDRIRHQHRSIKGRITAFAIQYEAFIQDRWHPVIRYDTAHGFSHLDRMHPDGSVDKVALPYWSYNEALTYAQQDLSFNWEWYRQKYQKELEVS
ncbi:MAG: hypothetical protein C4524_02860 [Candidatus Zixiibacteriota bacterium]|nr:MAG: hypothetical protein C4524_02860 [candidate division Zixibacteria bacterium]